MVKKVRLKRINGVRVKTAEDDKEFLLRPQTTNMKRLFEKGIDGYVADTLFRKRDRRFADASRYKERHRQGRREARMKSGGVLFTHHDFHYEPER